MAELRKLLVANRGEIASRVMRTAREMGIATVAVFSDPDASAPYVSEADEAVHLPGSAPGATYLSIDAVLGAARATGCDAVHPGYGFLSENAAFARACGDAGLVFVGPPAPVIESMGSKLAAKELMAAAGVPILPGAPVLPGATGSEGVDVTAAAAEIGWPILVKAAFGGGGRGMRVVRSPDELAAAISTAQRESESAFGDGTVFLERYLETPRHIEVQIFGDSHGNVIHLFERECSIQRRYQKIIEESPSPAVDDSLRAELGSAAVTAAKALGYVGAGTVEFVMAPDGAFFFLEVNTRLQVEHPVTEAITGLDLVRLQLLVAQGEPLPAAAASASTDGHAIEARLYAEDVAGGFLPAGGLLHRFRVPEGRDVRVDAGYTDGSTVSTFYDAMLAKVIAWAPTRAEAAARLADALSAAQIHGVTTNRDLLVRVLRHPSFLAGETDTGFLSRYSLVAPLAGADAARRHAVAAALAGSAGRRVSAPVQSTVPSGWRNVPTALQSVAFEVDDARFEVGYRFSRDGLSVSGFENVRLWQSSPELVDLSLDGVRRRYAVHQVGPVWYVDSEDGSSALHEVDRFPLPSSAAALGSLVAPMPGSVIRVLVEPGAVVATGETLVILEAMKMQHAVRAPHAGRVTEVRVSAGQQVDTGAVLAVLEEESA
jgi:acetyl/propionyl-CoA carboxylase alpha subunit